MMETLVQPYTPHLKKVLKKYQLSAVKSLQGPSNLLGPCSEVASPAPKTEAAAVTGRESPTAARTVRSPTADVDSFLPPPFPVQQLPILTEADQRSERGETVLEGESISCFVVGGEKRLCLPQVLNSVLQNFTLAQINQVCDELQIFCSRCNPEQLEVLKVTGILPASAPSCGLITKTDAERLCSALLQHGVPATSLPSPGAVSFQVYHECFGKCRGLCTPSLYTSPNARCIECLECHAMFSPQHFVCHAHRPLQNRTCHWGFDSSNWRSYLLVARGQPDYDVAVKLLNYLKETNVAAPPSNKRKVSHHHERKKGQHGGGKSHLVCKKATVATLKGDGELCSCWDAKVGSVDVIAVGQNHQSECQKSNQGLVMVSNRDSKPEVTAKKPKVEGCSPPPLESKPNEDSTRSHNGEKTEDVTPRLKALDVKESSIRRINEEALRSIGVKSVDDSALRGFGIKGFDERELKNVDDSYSAYLQYAAAAEPYIYWYDSWRTSAFRPWPSLTIKDSKSQTILRDSVPQSVPAYLSQGPPVLLHPERVIPLSESERFERTFQPNVALAPATHHRPKIECSDKQVKCEPAAEEDSKKAVLLCPPPSTPDRKAVLTVVTSSRYNPEIELSTDTDDSSSETTGEHGSIPRGERVVEQVAEVLDALSDAKEATRARVVALVQQLASRLNLEEANVRRLEVENSELRHVQREQEDLLASKDRRIAQLQQRLQEAESSNKEVEAFQNKVVEMEKEIRTSHAEMNGTSELRTSGGGSPVSVIRASPSVVIKTEPSE